MPLLKKFDKNGRREEMRHRMRRLRESMNLEEREWANGRIREKVLGHWNSAWRRLMVYVSLSFEVDTHGIIEQCLRNGVEVCVPCFHFELQKYLPMRIRHLSELRPGKFGVNEPEFRSELQVATDSVDVFLVPGLVFDPLGNRLGYGKGWFDSLCRNTSGIKIGLAYQFQIVGECPVHQGDVPMNRLITEKGVLICQKS